MSASCALAPDQFFDKRARPSRISNPVRVEPVVEKINNLQESVFRKLQESVFGKKESPFRRFNVGWLEIDHPEGYPAP
jgi:hypothetical protein